VEAGDVDLVAAGREMRRGVVVYLGSWCDGYAGTCGPDRHHLPGLGAAPGHRRTRRDRRWRLAVSQEPKNLSLLQ